MPTLMKGTTPIGALTTDSANLISYDGTNSGLAATDVQDAIDEVQGEIGSTDISAIGDGSVTGAISSLNSDLDSKLPKVIASSIEWVSSFNCTLTVGDYIFYGGSNSVYTVEVYSDGSMDINAISSGSWTLTGSSYILSGTNASPRWYSVIRIA